MIWTDFNLLSIRKLSCRSELFWFNGCLEDDFSITLPYFCYCLPFQEGLALYLNNFEFPLPKDVLYEVWLKLARWFSRRVLEIFSLFLLFPYHLPFEKGVDVHLNNSQFPLPKDDLCQLWFQLVQRFWRSRKCIRQTDNGRSEWNDGALNERASFRFKMDETCRWVQELTVDPFVKEAHTSLFLHINSTHLFLMHYYDNVHQLSISPLMYCKKMDADFLWSSQDNRCRLSLLLVSVLLRTC
jgi:hypothetical protein